MGNNSVANLLKTIYNNNVDLVNHDEQTKFGLILSISSQEIPNYDINQGRNSVANLRKTKIYITNVDLVNDYVYTKFGLNRSYLFSKY